ncbi:TPA: CHAP domain-containing protein [Salmonella enterica subsp. salamae serovar 28:r:e,n,z15]|nr:CHAP domain-containing protein [Salmonella enterica subsp. salamae serovar 28:r:e,n,z15]
MSWNKYRAVTYARIHAHAESQSQYAHYVTDAIRHGGLRIINTGEAKNMGPNLYAAGFRPVSSDPQEGDVAIIYPINHHPHGHGTWYSDFVQRTMYPSTGYRAQQPTYQLYRHN